MEIVAGRAETLPVGLLFDMARYRYEVFVHRLGWPLETQGRLELDQFDRRDTVYVIGRDAEGRVIGTARLLPTHRPYLLAEVFPQLMAATPMPCTPRTWELSRFAWLDLDASAAGQRRDGDARRALDFLRAVMRVAAAVGARDLVSVSPLAIERILRRGNIPYRRAGAPTKVGDDMLFACAISLDACHHEEGNARPASSILPGRTWHRASRTRPVATAQ